MARVQRLRWRGYVLAGAAALLSACGGVEAASLRSPGPYTIEVAGSPATFEGLLDLRVVKSNRAEVTLSDFAYSPTVVQAVRDTRVRLTLTNSSTTTHTFTIPGVVDVRLAPGVTEEVVLLAPAESGLAWMCRFHAESGMRGALNDPMPAPSPA